jgi:outer membrane protein
MYKSRTALGILTASVIALYCSVAEAQEHSYSQEVQVYGGEMFGDRLTETPVSGSTPRLNDTATVGGRYNFHFNERFGVQLEASYSPGSTGHAASGNGDVDIVLCDLDAVWNILPNYRFQGHRVVPYAVAGAGYAWALNMDRPIQGTIGTRPVSIDDSNGYTANAGLGARYYVTDSLFVDFNGRYRYFSRLVTNAGQGLNTAETSLGVGWHF